MEFAIVQGRRSMNVAVGRRWGVAGDEDSQEIQVVVNTGPRVRRLYARVNLG